MVSRTSASNTQPPQSGQATADTSAAKKSILFPLNEVGDSDNEDETLDLQQRIAKFGIVTKYDLPQISTILAKYNAHADKQWYATLTEIKTLLLGGQQSVNLEAGQKDCFKPSEFKQAVRTTYRHQLATPSRANITTVRCKDGVIKGTQLVEYCAKFEENRITKAKPKVTLKEASDKKIEIKHARDWLIYGQGFSNRGVKLFQGYKRSPDPSEVFYKDGVMSPKINARPQGCYFYTFNTITMQSGIKLRLDRSMDRLHLDEDLKFGDKAISDILGKAKTDLTYSDITVVFEHIKKTYRVPNKNGNKVSMSDAIIAKLQLKLFKCEKVEGLPPELHKWLDFCNVLMCGVEASRFHGGILTSLMSLELVKEGQLSYSELFSGVEVQQFDDNGNVAKTTQFGGQYYGATLKSGEGNGIDRQQALNASSSMKPARADPIHYGVLVKEVITIKTWCAVEGLDSTKCTQDKFSQRLKDALIELSDKYLSSVAGTLY